MKPIPAIDENGDWIDVSITGGVNVTLLALGGAYCVVVDPDNNPFRLPTHLIADLPAVRERVERARKARETPRARLLAQAARCGCGICDACRFLEITETDATLKRPSFAEALEQELRNEARYITNPVGFAEILNVIYRARAASGEEP